MVISEEARETGVPAIVRAGPLGERVEPWIRTLWLLRGRMVWPPIVKIGFDVGRAAGRGLGMAKV